MTDQRGLYGKFIIEKADGTPLHPLARYFVLNYALDEDGQAFDPAARLALLTYADYAGKHGNPGLEAELRAALENPNAAHSHEVRE